MRRRARKSKEHENYWIGNDWGESNRRQNPTLVTLGNYTANRECLPVDGVSERYSISRTVELV